MSMSSYETKLVKLNTARDEEKCAVRERLCTLLDLAVAIGKREGLLGNNRSVAENCERSEGGGRDVTDERRLRCCKTAEARKVLGLSLSVLKIDIKRWTCR